MREPTLTGAVCALILASVCSGQMSGAFTISASGAGPRNFKTFTAATNALAAQGINGPVLFNVLPATIRESWVVPPVRGSSPRNTVTFQGVASPPSVYLTRLIGVATSIVTLSPGASNIVFDGLDFVSATRGHAISGDANNGGGTVMPISNVEIKNCRFGPGILGTSGRGQISVLGGGRSARWSIHHNIFNMGQYVAGVYLHHLGEVSFTCNRVNVTNSRNAVHFQNLFTQNNVLANNVFAGSVRSPESSCIVHVVAMMGATDICFNTFRVRMSGAAICTEGNPLAYNRIYSNIIAVKGFGRGIDVRTRAHWFSDGNLFFIESGIIGQILLTRHRSLGSWQRAARLRRSDVNSLVGDPRFKSATDMHLSANSPGVGRARLVRGRYEPRFDFDGFVRGFKQDIGAYELTGYRLYERGCPGQRGIIPRLSIGGNVAPTERVSIDLDDARASTNAVLSIGAPKAKIPTGPGCHFWHTPRILLFTRTDRGGRANVAVTIPNVSVTGASAFLQFAVHDPASPLNLALSAGAEVRL